MAPVARNATRIKKTCASCNIVPRLMASEKIILRGLKPADYFRH